MRKKLAALEGEGRAPVLSHEDAELSRLMRSMENLNGKAAADYGFEPLPVSGGTDLERYRSLNAWLGRDPDAPIDGTTVSDLDLKVVEALMR